MDDNPTKKNVIETRTLDKPGRLYDADEQCQLAYGQAAKFCGGEKFIDVSVLISPNSDRVFLVFWHVEGGGNVTNC